MIALFPHLWELWRPGLCHPLCNITKPHRAPGRHPWKRSGICPAGKGGALLIPASALSLTGMISMFLSLPLPSSFSSAQFISASNHWLTQGAWPWEHKMSYGNEWSQVSCLLVTWISSLAFQGLVPVFTTDNCVTLDKLPNFLCLTCFISLFSWGLNELTHLRG